MKRQREEDEEQPEVTESAPGAEEDKEDEVKEDPSDPKFVYNPKKGNECYVVTRSDDVEFQDEYLINELNLGDIEIDFDCFRSEQKALYYVLEWCRTMVEEAWRRRGRLTGVGIDSDVIQKPIHKSIVDFFSNSHHAIVPVNLFEYLQFNSESEDNLVVLKFHKGKNKYVKVKHLKLFVEYYQRGEVPSDEPVNGRYRSKRTLSYNEIEVWLSDDSQCYKIERSFYWSE